MNATVAMPTVPITATGVPAVFETYPPEIRDALTFEGNRAIVLHKTADLPIAALKHCITLALTYHRRKKLPLLGATPQRR